MKKNPGRMDEERDDKTSCPTPAFHMEEKPLTVNVDPLNVRRAPITQQQVQEESFYTLHQRYSRQVGRSSM